MTNYEWLKTLSLEDMASAINDAKLNGSRILASSCGLAYHKVAIRLWLQNEHSDQKTGNWLPVFGDGHTLVCSSCLGMIDSLWVVNRNYCPSCGAKMEESHQAAEEYISPGVFEEGVESNAQKED